MLKLRLAACCNKCTLKGFRWEKSAPIVLLTMTLSFISITGLSQTVTFKGDNIPLRNVFAEIKKQTGYTFLGNSDLLEKAKKVTLNIKNVPLKEALDLLCKNQPFTYALEGKIIAIRPLTEKKNNETTLNLTIQIIEDPVAHGVVKDKYGGLIAGVTVTSVPQEKHRKVSTATLANGTFEIRAQKGDKLKFSNIGYKEIEINYGGEPLLNITMEEEADELNKVTVNNMDFSRKKIPWTDTIDMTHRGHQNLGQVLQGTIPGLTLQNSSQSQKVIVSFTDADGSRTNNEAMRARYEEYANYWRTVGINDYGAFLSNLGNLSVKTNYSTALRNNGLVPQLRGVSGFNGNTSGMLIVIDGFPQDGFPADYPMSNIESVKVIKDPEELAKWGPKAAGGAVIVTSKRAQAGKLQLGYSANVIYSPATRFSRERQRFASSNDILSYLKAASDSGFLILGQETDQRSLFNLNPAESLLSGLQQGKLSPPVFDALWDSLGKINNESQIRLLQQNSFNQNQILRLSGGSKAYRFVATGSYNTTRTTALNNYGHSAGLTMNNDFLLLKNKLRAQLYLNVSDSKTRAGYDLDPTTLPPYQLLLNSKGGYVSDYTTFNPDANDTIRRYGYEDYGVNLLQDARINSNITKTFQAQSRLNADWDLLPGLKWSSSFQYDLNNGNTENLQDAASSPVRQMVDNYGTPYFDNNQTLLGINYYIPRGGILRRSFSTARVWNLRSALIFDKNFRRHHLAFTFGGGGSSTVARRPSYSTIYGYSAQTGKGQPLQLPSPDPTAGITGFYPLLNNLFPSAGGLQFFPNTLFVPIAGDTSIIRGLNWNGNIHYSYDDTYTLNGSYNTVLNPNYGYNPPYTTQTNYSAEAIWRLSKYSFLQLPKWISDLSLSYGLTGNKIPTLPTQISAMRTLQTNWNNYSIWVGNYNIAQQTGQDTRNIYEKLTVGVADNHLVLDLIYNSLHITGGTNKGIDSSLTKNYFGANAKLKLRGGLLNLIGSFGRSPEGQTQTNIRAAYNIGKENYFQSSTISSLSADFTLQNISAYQALALIAETNAPQAGGSFSIAINNNFGLLPPQTKNLEAHASIGFLKDRYLLDLRYYRKTTSGLDNSIPLPTDPSTGLGTQISYSEIVNKGVELYLVIKAVQQKQFNYTVTLNGAYNKNIAQSVPQVNFSQTESYLTAYRNGYSTENIWSYRWAGLDNSGNPQIYNTQGEKTANPDSATLASSSVYSGVTRAPCTGGVIQEWNYNGFFTRVTLLFNLGHVMREYIPSSSGTLNNSILIRDRWRPDNPFTDIAAMSNAGGIGTPRELIIQNSSNSILKADNIRLQELQIGWQSPERMFKHFFIRNLTLSFQAQNLAVWTRNKLHVDPETVASAGQIGLPRPKQYSFSVNMNF